MLPSVLEEEKCVKQYYIQKMFPKLMNRIPTNTQAKVLQKLPTIPTVSTPSTIKVVVGGQLSSPICMEHANKMTKQPYKKFH